MVVVLFTSFISLFLTFFDSKNKLRGGMKLGFILITILAAIRYNYGNDYIGYYEDFSLIGRYSFGEILFLQEQMQYIDPAFKDVGAAILYRFFKPIGFIGFVAVISIFQGCVYYQFIKENVPRSYWWFAVFIYLFDFFNYVLQMSMIRQGLVITLFVWSWHFLRERKFLFPILIMFLSFTIHKSSVVFFPFLFLTMLFYKKRKMTMLLLGFLTVFMWSASSVVSIVLGHFMDMEFFQLYNQAYGMEDGGRVGIARLLLAYIPYMFAFFYLFNVNVNDNLRILVIISMIGTLILPFTTILPMISRLCFYFNIFMISAFPITLSAEKHIIIKRASVLLFVCLSLYQYFDLFLHSVYTESFAKFKTIFSVLI